MSTSRDSIIFALAAQRSLYPDTLACRPSISPSREMSSIAPSRSVPDDARAASMIPVFASSSASSSFMELSMASLFDSRADILSRRSILLVLAPSIAAEIESLSAVALAISSSSSSRDPYSSPSPIAALLPSRLLISASILLRVERVASYCFSRSADIASISLKSSRIFLTRSAFSLRSPISSDRVLCLSTRASSSAERS